MIRNGNYITVISKGRPENVPKMEQLVGPATWYVPQGEAMDYVKAGAPSVWEMIVPGLCHARNSALEDAFHYDLNCVQISDDLKRLERMYQMSGGRYLRATATFDEYLQVMQEALTKYSAKFAGIAPTDNDYFFNPQRKVTQDTFIVGDLMMIKPSKPRFDNALKLKEDYDFTMQHIRHYGTVARCNNLLASFSHRSNKGGAVAFRNEEREMEAIKYLKGKWGSWIKLNPKRPNEVLLRLPRGGSGAVNMKSNARVKGT